MGSFDVVMHNMRRFTESFPGYRRRGIAVTLTAASDFDEVNEFLKPLMAVNQTIVARFVRPPDERFQKKSDARTFQNDVAHASLHSRIFVCCFVKQQR